MRPLPSGTVTFLFTDIEGSTRLLHELGDAYADALAEHRRALRKAFAAHGGVEVDTQGDALFAAFARATDALAAASEGQAALSGGPISVRMGLHTGEPIVTEEGYVGVDVHKGARIAACGHGGQVLVSQTTRDLCGADGLRDLGEHRLKDLTAPERIYQLGKGEFPPLKTLYQTNLPVPATPFLGRERELSEIQELLARDAVRLLTLTGAGGTGKTRLALHAAAEAADAYPAGVWWVPLAPVADAESVFDVAAAALGAQGALAETIGARRLLLLFDNFEHVIGAAPRLAELLAACPGLNVLVTSRERLQLDGEQVYPVPVLARTDAGELFSERARAVRPGFEPDAFVAEICERLDDLPLALELAAARVGMLSTEQLLAKLGRRLDLLKGGRDADVRQRTLRATIEWSYQLLSLEQQQLLGRLAVFAGGCTLEAAEAICGAELDALQSLVDKSLVRVVDGPRFWMLETIREFALERLAESGEEHELRRAHAEWFRELAETALLAHDSPLGPQRYDLVNPEGANLRATIEWLSSECDAESALATAVALENYWVTQSPFKGAQILAGLLDRPGISPLLHARALRAIGGATNIVGDIDTASEMYGRALAEFRALDDRARVAAVLHRLANLALARNDAEDAARLVEQTEELLPDCPETRLHAQLLHTRGSIERMHGRLNEALDLYVASARRAHEIGFTWWEALCLGDAAEVAALLGRGNDAARHMRDALPLCHGIGDRLNTIWGLANFADLAAAEGDVDRAGMLWGAIEAEERRGVLSVWEQERSGVVDRLPPLPPDAVASGRAMTLDEAVEYALAVD